VKKDLLAEHASLKKECVSLRAAIKEGLFGRASVQEMRQLQADLFKAEDRMKTIERSKQWDNRSPAVKVTH
jgi:hypothetical protein